MGQTISPKKTAFYFIIYLLTMLMMLIISPLVPVNKFLILMVSVSSIYFLHKAVFFKIDEQESMDEIYSPVKNIITAAISIITGFLSFYFLPRPVITAYLAMILVGYFINTIDSMCEYEDGSIMLKDDPVHHFNINPFSKFIECVTFVPHTDVEDTPSSVNASA